MVQPQKRLTGKIGPSIARTCPPDCLTSFRVPSVWLHCARSEHTDLQLEHHYKGLLGGLQDASQLDKVCQGQLVRVYELRQRRGREGSRAYRVETQQGIRGSSIEQHFSRAHKREGA